MGGPGGYNPYMFNELGDNARDNLGAFGSWLKTTAGKAASAAGGLAGAYGNFLTAGGGTDGGLIQRARTATAPSSPSVGFSSSSPTEEGTARGESVAPQQATTNAIIQWMMQRLGMTADQAIVALSQDVAGFYTKTFLDETGTRAGASAPVARYGFQTIGGKVYRANDLTGTLEDTGISAPGFSSVDLDRNGNLTGIDADGNFKVIQPNYGFAAIDPSVTAAEDTRRFNVGAGQRDTEEQGRNARNTESEQAANQRQQLSSQTAGFQSINTLAPQLGKLALDNAEFTRDVLSTPADFLARAFFQRGQTSPLPQISQADVINQLRENIAGFQGALSTYQNTFPGFTSPQTNTAVVPSTAASSAPAGFSATPPAVPQPGPQPGFSAPTAAPITLDTATGQWMQGGQAVNPFDQSGNLSVSHLGPTPAPPVGFTAAPPPPPAPAPTWGGMTFSAPTLPTFPSVTQSELQGMELANRPPAVNDILNGRMPSPLNVGFSLPTPEMWGALTPDEKKASATTFATQYNTTPEDVGFAIERSFSKPRTRRSATVAGFASGGFTRDQAFLGNEKGAELFINPTNAPIAIVDAKTTEEMVGAGPDVDYDDRGRFSMMRQWGSEDGANGRDALRMDEFVIRYLKAAMPGADPAKTPISALNPRNLDNAYWAYQQGFGAGRRNTAEQQHPSRGEAVRRGSR